MQPPNSMILGKDIYFSLDDYITKLNNNVLVAGGPGAGKTRNVISPNVASAVGSYIISDPKGSLYDMYNVYLKEKGYKVKHLDFYHPEKSTDGYNFFEYINSEIDIIKIADMLVYSENGKNTVADPFWGQASQLLLQSLIAYIWKYQPPNQRNLEVINRFINRINIPDENDVLCVAQNEIDVMMRNLPVDDFARRSYEKFAIATSKTIKSILISTNALVGRWDTKEINDLLSGDTMELDKIGSEKIAIFVTTSDTDRSMDGLINIFFEQTLRLLCNKADTQCLHQRLPIPVRYMLDDFANTVMIHSIPTAIAGARSRGIAFTVCIQSESQLKRMYGSDANTIVGCCDTYVYMGGNDLETAKKIAERANKPLSKILQMPVGYSWIFRRGAEPIYAENYKSVSLLERKDHERV